MDLEEELGSKSAPRIKKAAVLISKEKLFGFESALVSSLEFIIQRPKSWKAQIELIKALGITGSSKSIPYLKELSKQEFKSTIIYKYLGFSICLLEDIANDELTYTKSILDTPNESLLSGVCSAILYSNYRPKDADIQKILKSVIDRNKSEGQVISPRTYIAAACFCWPPRLTEEFLEKCKQSTWSTLVEISNDSLNTQKTKYILV